MRVLTSINDTVHAQHLKPAERLLLLELTFGGPGTLTGLESRMEWARPTLRIHLTALERARIIQRKLDARAFRYCAKAEHRPDDKRDQQTVRTMLRIIRHSELSAAERIVLLHLALCGHHFHTAESRAARLGVSLSGYERARTRLRSQELVTHDHAYNAPLPGAGFRHLLRVPIRVTEHDDTFRRCADLLWKANTRKGPTHPWWWQAFRELSESESIAPVELLKLTFQIADNAGKPGFPRIHNPTQVLEHIPLLRKLRSQMLKKADRLLGNPMYFQHTQTGIPWPKSQFRSLVLGSTP